MSFPHLRSERAAAVRHTDSRAVIANIISRQSSGATARLMLVAAQNRRGLAKSSTDLMEQRIRYFAARRSIGPQGAPHGAFFISEGMDLGSTVNGNQAVYQDGLANGKVDAANRKMFEFQAIVPGQEN